MMTEELKATAKPFISDNTGNRNENNQAVNMIVSDYTLIQKQQYMR